MFAVLLTGPPGAGKSTLATAVHDRLGDAGVPNALIEVDELERCYPPLDEARVFANLGAICAGYRDAGHTLLFVTATIEDDASGERLLNAVGAAGHLLVRLEAEPATLRRRILDREPEGWSGLDDLLAASELLAARLPGLSGVELVLSTENTAPADLAARVEAAIATAGHLPEPTSLSGSL